MSTNPIFGFNEVVAICAWGAFTFYQFSSLGSWKSRSWYDDNAPAWGPPGYVFGIIWTILYAATTTAMFYFTQNSQADSWQLILGVVMYMVHMYFNKLWSVYFWDYNDPRGALYILIFPILLTGVGLLIAMVVDQSGLFWVPVMLLCIYIAWLLYALALNVYWVNMDLDTMKSVRERNKQKRQEMEKKMLSYNDFDPSASAPF